VINEQEFRGLIIGMGILKEQQEVEQLLQYVDPFNN
jgi:hypothetical protein